MKLKNHIINNIRKTSHLVLLLELINYKNQPIIVEESRVDTTNDNENKVIENNGNIVMHDNKHILGQDHEDEDVY